MQAPKKSPIFCSFGVRPGEGFAACLEYSPEELQILLRQLAVDVQLAWSGGIGFSLFQLPQEKRQKSTHGSTARSMKAGSRLGV